VVPSVVWSGAYLLLPVLIVCYLSLTAWGGFDTPRFLGLGNYKTLSGPDFTSALKVTLLFAFIGGLISVVVGFTLAVVIQQRLYAWKFYRVLWFMPVLIPGSVTALLWQGGAYLPQSGLFDTLVKDLGFTPPSQGWLGTPEFALPGVIVVAIWASAGFPMLLLSAAMERVPRELSEAAAIDGCSRTRVALHVTLPLIRPVLATVAALQVIGMMKTFDLIYVLTTGGPGTKTTTLAYLVYSAGFIVGKSGLASAYAVVMIILITPLALMARGWIGSDDD
jgi:raffinose/stachyose/melibiose transport system permease protein